jgi:hypothetical protein
MREVLSGNRHRTKSMKNCVEMIQTTHVCTDSAFAMRVMSGCRGAWCYFTSHLTGVSQDGTQPVAVRQDMQAFTSVCYPIFFIAVLAIFDSGIPTRALSTVTEH